MSHKKNFRQIKEIKLDDEKTWNNTIFLTIDIDWAHDDIISDTIQLLEHADVPATWFVTHDTPLLEKLRKNPQFELGIHPNFNEILQRNSADHDTIESRVDDLLRIVQDAKSVRSHSMLQSSQLIELFSTKGLIYDCNHFIPEQANIILKPWRLWNGIIKVPYFWEDDLYCMYAESSPLPKMLNRKKGIQVFDFHPIHIFLNTNNLDQYKSTRKLHGTANKLIHYRQKGFGSRTMLIDLISR